MSEEEVGYIYDANNIRISDHDERHWLVEWAYEGQRSDFIGHGWVAVVEKYTPQNRFRWEQQFVDRSVKLVEKSLKPILLRYGDVCQGGSRYAHEKYGGRSGMILIEPGGKARGISEAKAVTIAEQRAETPVMFCRQHPDRQAVGVLEIVKRAMDGRIAEPLSSEGMCQECWEGCHE